MDGAGGGFEGTPLVTSPRVAAAQHRSLQAQSSEELPESVSFVFRGIRC